MNVKKQAPYPLDRKSSVQNIKKKKNQVSASGGKLTQFFYLKISQVRQKKQTYFNVAGSGFPPLDALYTPHRVVTNSGEQRSELDQHPCPWEMVSRDCITGTPLLSGFPLVQPLRSQDKRQEGEVFILCSLIAKSQFGSGWVAFLYLTPQILMGDHPPRATSPARLWQQPPAPIPSGLGAVPRC